GGVAAPPPDHDDGARCRARLTPRGAVHGSWFRYSEAVRARDRRRAVLASAHQRVPHARTLCRFGPRERPLGGLISTGRRGHYRVDRPIPLSPRSVGALHETLPSAMHTRPSLRVCSGAAGYIALGSRYIAIF